MAVLSAACGSPAWTSDADGSVTSLSFDVVWTASTTQVDGQCLEDVLVPKTDCSVSCAALLVYPNQTDQAAGCTDPGTSQPDPATLARFAAQQPGDGPAPVACLYRQLVGGASSSVARATGCTNDSPDYSGESCAGGEQAGWCYAMGADVTGGCPVAIQVGASAPPRGTHVHFDCLQAVPPN